MWGGLVCCWCWLITDINRYSFEKLRFSRFFHSFFFISTICTGKRVYYRFKNCSKRTNTLHAGSQDDYRVNRDVPSYYCLAVSILKSSAYDEDICCWSVCCCLKFWKRFWIPLSRSSIIKIFEMLIICVSLG